MFADIIPTRYAKVTRNGALKILQNANLEPAKFVAHRDGTFTARYRRKTMAAPESYETRLEQASQYPVAVFKRPSKKLDRGPYASMHFAFGPADDVKRMLAPAAINHERGTTNGAAPPFEVLVLLANVARDIRQLADEAQRMTQNDTPAEHLQAVVEELKRQSGDLVTIVETMAAE